MSQEGKVRVLVRSRKVPVRTIDLNQTIYTPSGMPMGTTMSRALLYDYVLDEDHLRTIQEARKLASNLCLDLEVIDSARQGIFGRLMASLTGRGTGNPAIEVSPRSSTASSEGSPILAQIRQ